MASRRINRPLQGNGRDGRDYGDFMKGLLDGSIVATKLVDTTVPQGPKDIVIPQFAQDGSPLPDVVVTVNERRLTKLEYDDPRG